MSTEDRLFLIEYLDDKFAVLIEAMESLIDRKLQPVAAKVDELSDDMKVVKAAVTATNVQVQDHETRITKLEAA